jgi:hypothetical protein
MNNSVMLYIGMFLILMIPFLIPGAALYLLQKIQAKRINPLTKSLRRQPGTQLGRELGGQQTNIGLSFLLISIGVYFPLMAHLWQSYIMGKPESSFRVLITLIGMVGMTGYGVYDLIRRIKRLQVLRLGYECELAVGQELDLLMLQGYRVFHDIPAEGFNIDHLVIGKNGVFAVETKGRSKRANKSGDSKAEYKIDYENGVLKFPGWQETRPIEQASSQARWASQWLSSAVGERIFATPVLIFPGWFINIKSRPEVLVLAAGQISHYFPKLNGQSLNEKQIQQIVYQVDQKVRDLAPGELVRPLDEDETKKAKRA